MTTSTTWRLVPAEPDQAWTDSFAARGPRIGTFGATIRAVLDTAPAPAFDILGALSEVRASLAFLPATDAAVSGLDCLITAITATGECDCAPKRAAFANEIR